jgi:hypothetical protein
MVQQSLDHVTVTIFDGSDERGHTVLVFRSNGWRRDEQRVRRDEELGEKVMWGKEGGDEEEKRTTPFCSMKSRAEGWARIWVTLLRSPSDEA